MKPPDQNQAIVTGGDSGIGRATGGSFGGVWRPGARGVQECGQVREGQAGVERGDRDCPGRRHGFGRGGALAGGCHTGPVGAQRGAVPGAWISGRTHLGNVLRQLEQRREVHLPLRTGSDPGATALGEHAGDPL